MNNCHWIAAATVLLSFAGCGHFNQSTEMLETELRWLEDQLYNAEDQYQAQTAELDKCRRENQALRKELGIPDGQNIDVAPSIDLTPPPKAARPPDLPHIDLGTPTDDPISPAHEFELPDPGGDGAGPSSETGKVVDPRVTSIHLDSRLTGGYNHDNTPGDEGIALAIEPCNAAGRYVPLPGAVSVVVLDPARHGEAARIARWDLTEEDVTRELRKTVAGRGIHLELPWPDGPPDHSRLRLYVRYTTLDGRDLEADRQIIVRPPGELVHGWTPAPADRRRRIRPAHVGQSTAELATQTPEASSSLPLVRSVLVTPRSESHVESGPTSPATRWEPERSETARRWTGWQPHR